MTRKGKIELAERELVNVYLMERLDYFTKVMESCETLPQLRVATDWALNVAAQDERFEYGKYTHARPVFIRDLFCGIRQRMCDISTKRIKDLA